MQAAERTSGPPSQADDVHHVEAFAEFARREQPNLIALAWSLTGNLGAAEEVAQEALAAAWQTWSLVGSYDKPGAWARRVVINQAATWRRRQGREMRAVARLAGRARADHVELPLEDDTFWRAVRALPARQGQAVALFYLWDRPVAEIAEVLGCSESTVRVHLHRARLTLARTLGLDAEEDET